VPVDLDVELDDRLAGAVETGAYYVVAEALTNVAKHARARRAAVDIRRAGDSLVVEVRDNGRGGAARVPGSGLDGLAHRVEALDGTPHHRQSDRRADRDHGPAPVSAVAVSQGRSWRRVVLTALGASCAGRLSCSVHYTLAVPPGVAVDVSSGFSDIDAAGLASASSIRLETTAGDIAATGLSAPDVRLSTGVGSLDAELAHPARRLTAGTVAGSLKLTVPDTT
jgi:hypothetical protein